MGRMLEIIELWQEENILFPDIEKVDFETQICICEQQLGEIYERRKVY